MKKIKPVILAPIIATLALTIIPTAMTPRYAFADADKCDQPGWPSCYSLGFQDGHQCISNDKNAISPHSLEWHRGFVAGFATCGTSNNNGNSQVNNASNNNGNSQQNNYEVQNGRGSIDWNRICNDIQSVLVESCSQLANQDGSFTPEGQHAYNCIRNGVLVGLGSYGIGVPLPFVIKGLQILASHTGCDNIVNWNYANSGILNQMKQLIH